MKRGLRVVWVMLAVLAVTALAIAIGKAGCAADVVYQAERIEECRRIGRPIVRSTSCGFTGRAMRWWILERCEL